MRDQHSHVATVEIDQSNGSPAFEKKNPRIGSLLLLLLLSHLRCDVYENVNIRQNKQTNKQTSSSALKMTMRALSALAGECLYRLNALWCGGGVMAAAHTAP